MNSLRFRKALMLLLVIVLMSYTTSIIAYADMGPKPSITVTVENAPEEYYIIDLLMYGGYRAMFDDDNGYDVQSFMAKYTDSECNMLQTLLNYTDDDGMRARIGCNIGEQYVFANGAGDFSFNYDMIPDEFGVIIVTESGRIYISEKCTKHAYNANVTYDVKKGTLQEDKMTIAIPHIIRFMVTFLATLFIEWIALLLFKYRLREGKNGRVFLLTNLGTQLFMYLFLQFLGGFILLAEILIVAIEAFVYSHLLTPNKQRRADGYAITANIFSFLLGLPLWAVLFFIFPR